MDVLVQLERVDSTRQGLDVLVVIVMFLVDKAVGD